MFNTSHDFAQSLCAQNNFPQSKNSQVKPKRAPSPDILISDSEDDQNCVS